MSSLHRREYKWEVVNPTFLFFNKIFSSRDFKGHLNALHNKDLHILYKKIKFVMIY